MRTLETRIFPCKCWVTGEVHVCVPSLSHPTALIQYVGHQYFNQTPTRQSAESKMGDKEQDGGGGRKEEAMESYQRRH